jgi:Trk K+ transport system NAD-binding subunit
MSQTEKRQITRFDPEQSSPLHDFSYQKNKRWHAFKQNYRLKKQIKTILKLFSFIIFLWVLGSLLTILTQWLFLDSIHQSSSDYLKYFWVVIIELISGFDIPDGVNLHLSSRVVSVFLLLLNLTVVALFTGQIVSMFSEILKRKAFLPQKPENFQFANPIIICGINEKLQDIIYELRDNPNSKYREIVIIDEKANTIEKEPYEGLEDIWYIKGNAMDRTILQKSIGSNDNRVIILSKKTDDGVNSDINALNSAMAVEVYDESCHTVVEIYNPKNKIHFDRTIINDWICIEDFAMLLVSQACIKPSIVKAYYNLLGGMEFDKTHNRIDFSQELIPKSLYGKSYLEIKKQLFHQLKKQGLIIIGFSKYVSDETKNDLGMKLRNGNDFIQINPPKLPSQNSPAYISKKPLDNGRSLLLQGKNEDRIIYLDQDKKSRFQISEWEYVENEGMQKSFYWVFSRDTNLNENDKLVVIRRNAKHTETEQIEQTKVNNMDKQKNKANPANNNNHKPNKTFQDHIIICNWSPRVEVIIEELRDETIRDKSPIVIITKDKNRVEEKEDLFDDVFVIEGDPISEKTLKRAWVESAKTVLILADDQNRETTDSQSVLIALAVNKFNPKAHLVTELIYAKHEQLFKYIHVDELVCLEKLSEKLLAQSALTPGLSQVYMNMLTQSASTNEIYIETVPQSFLDNEYTYEKAEEKIMSLEKDCILIGFTTQVQEKHEDRSYIKDSHGNKISKQKIVINPSTQHNSTNHENDYSVKHKLNKDDKLFVISFDKPYLSEIL